VKKKMTQDEFCRNLRGTNDGQDFPREFLTAIYASISQVGGPFVVCQSIRLPSTNP
jgi:Sec7-like guanine-nucleotide exchange factor